MAVTTIAGFVGAVVDDTSKALDRALTALGRYGAGAATGDLGQASFGALGSNSDLANHRLAAAPGFLCALDGRIDNRLELRRLLNSPDLTDAQIVLFGWERFGQQILDRLIGDFAFALFDRRDGDLWLARDPGGDRPLVYGLGEGRVGFASMPSGVMAGLGLSEPDLAHAARYLQGLADLSGSTFWSGVREVPTGTLVRIGRQVSQHYYFQPPTPLRDAACWPEMVEMMRDRLDTAVTRSLAGVGTVVGGQLSSGLDSSAIVSTAARRAPPDQTILALTAAPPPGARLLVQRGRYADESGLAAETARMNGIDHIVVRNTERLLPAVRGMAHYFQQPAPAQYSFPWWRQMGTIVRQRGGQVLLTGGQGNSVISYGGLHALSRYLAQGRARRWWRETRLAARNENVRVRGLVFNSVQSLLPPALAMRMLRRAYGLPSSRISFVRPEWLQAGQAASRWSYLESRMAMIRGYDAGIRKRGMFALTGVEERDPSGDRELMEFSLSMPPEAHLREGRIKPLIREALSGRVPGAVLDNLARGMSGADWYDRIGPQDCRDAMEDIAASRSASQLLDLDSLQRAIADWPPFDPRREGWLGDFGRSIARALSTGLFLAETDRYPLGS